MTKRSGKTRPRNVSAAEAYRVKQMKILRKMKAEIQKLESSQEKIAQHQRELLEAHTDATLNMHRSMLGKGPRKKKKKSTS